jgi:hypothetical protein
VAADIAARLAVALARMERAGRIGLAIEAPLPVPASGVSVSDLSSTSVVALPDVIHRAREQFDVAIVAPDEGRSQRAFLAMEHADRIVLPSDLTVAGIRSTQRVLQLLQSLGFPYDKSHVVLYDLPHAVPFTPADAALALKREVYFHLLNGIAAAEAYDELARKLIAFKGP